MGFATPVNTIVSSAISYATDLFADFSAYIALIVGFMLLGLVVSWFLSRL